MLYLVIVILLILLSYEFDYCRKKKYWSFWYYFLLLIFICLAGFRYRLGSDTINYMKWFENVSSFSNLVIDFSDYEIGFVLLASFVKTIGGGFYMLQFIVAAIFNISFFSFVRRYCRNYFFLCILIYFFMYYWEICYEVMRASIAIAIFLYSIPLLLKKKYMMYYAYCVVAFFFHYSSIFLFLIPLFGFLKLNKYSLSLLILILISYVYINSVFANLFFLMTFNERMADTAELYVMSDTFGAAGGMNIRGYVSKCFVPILTLLLPLYLYKRWTKNRYQFESFIVLMIFFKAAIVGIPILYRIAYFFFPMAIICMARILFLLIGRLKSPINRYFVMLIFILLPYFTYFFFAEYNPKMSGYSRFYMYYPYSSIFDEDINYQRETIYRREF